MWQEDASGNRTAVSLGLTYPGTLADGEYIDGTFPGPLAQSTKYVLVFKGTIGTSGATALDPVDEGIAIAARSFTVDPPTVRVSPLTSEIPRLRIKDYELYRPLINPACPECEPDSSDPEWAGLFPVWTPFEPYWHADTGNPASFQVNGWRMGNSDVAYAWLYNGEHGTSAAFWQMSVFCAYYDPELPGCVVQHIWYGVKTTGDTPLGVYWRNELESGCFDPNSPDLLTIEAY